ncbi:MAG: tetratricopeptide repeat protein, partial [Deferrisomatales bacterium]
RVLAGAPDRADAYLLLGRAFLKEGKFEPAVAQFDEAIKLAPTNLHYLGAKATAYLFAQRLKESRQVVDEMLKVDPANSGTLLLLAQVADLQGDTEAARRALAKLVEVEPRNPQGWLALGNFWLKHEDMAQAIQAYQQAAEVDPEGTAGLERVAEVTVTKGDLEAARKGVAAIYARNPKSLAGKYYEGRIFLAEKKNQDAASRLQEVLNEYPKHPQAHFFLGLAHYGQGNLQLARRDLEQAVEIRPDFGKARLLLAQILLDSRDFSAAEKATDELLKAPQVPIEVLLIRGHALLAQGRAADARKAFETVTQSLPDHARALEGVGLTHLAERKPDLALPFFRKALAKDPAYLRPLELAAQTLVAQGEKGKALSLVQEHLKTTGGGSAEARTLLGRLYAQAGDKPRARQELEQAIALAPEGIQAYYALAALYSGPEELRTGLETVARSLEQQPKQVYGWVMKGQFHDQLKEHDEANKAYRKAIELHPGSAPALNNLAWNLAEYGGNLDEALKFAEKAVEAAPNDPGANDTLGWIYVKKGANLKGLAHLEAAVRSLADNPAVHYHLGKAYANLEEKKKAVASLKRALQLAPAFEGAEEAKTLLGALE